MSPAENLSKIESLAESLESLSAAFNLFIIFVDLCNSTEIKQFCLEEQLPDSFWIARQKIFLGRTATVVRQYGGQIIKTIGDEIMGTFSTDTNPADILKCGIEVFQRFQGLKTYDKGRFKIRAKASLDIGTCYDGSIDDSGRPDPIGTCVDRCARLNKLASPGQIIMSKPFKERLGLSTKAIHGIQIIEQSQQLPGLGNTEFYIIDVGNA